VTRIKAAHTALVSMFAAYTTAWSYISMLRVYSLNASIFDLGINMQFAWDAAYRFTVGSFIHNFAYKGIVYAVLPVFLTGNYAAVLIFQSAFLGFGVFPIYGISRHYMKNSLAPLLISASYLMYFPLAGINWFDFHYQALFPTLFLLGYYFYLNKRESVAFIFMALSATTHYPYAVFPLMFALLLLAGKNRRRDLKLSISLLAFTLAIFALNFILNGAAGATLGAVGGAQGNPSTLVNAYTLFIILLPLLFLPLMSKWVLFLVPYTALIFVSGYVYFRFPFVFMFQYSALFVPFVFLGTIEGISRFKRRSKTVSALLFVTVIVFASAYEPYSPLNSSSSVNYSLLGYGFNSIINTNWIRYNGLVKTLSMIPPNSTVIVQNNMPEIYILHENLTVYDSLFVGSQQVNGASVEVVDPYALWFFPNYFNELWSTGNYGLASEADGIVMIERNYSAQPEYFSPLTMNYPSNQLAITGSAHLSDGAIEASNVSNSKLWFGPWTSIVPGLYKVTFLLKGVNLSNESKVELLVTANDWGTVLGSKTINGTQFGEGWTPITLNFYVNNIYQQVEFIGYADNISGTLLMKNVSLTQVGPGLPNANDLYVYPGQLDLGDGTYALTNGSITAVNESNEMAWYGPYTTLQPGHYLVKYMLSTTNSSPYNRAMLQVTADSGNVMLGEQGITGAYTAPVQLCINGTATNVEFRGYVENWQGNLTVNGIEIIEAGPEVNYTYPAYGLYSTYYTNGTISGTNNEMAWYGPYTTLCPGNYSVTFWLNGSASVNLQVTAGYGSVYLASNTVHVSGPGRFTLNFTVSQEEQYVEFRGYVINGSVELEKCAIRSNSIGVYS